eukprot:1503049-Amphidinium_carterae.1
MRLSSFTEGAVQTLLYLHFHMERMMGSSKVISSSSRGPIMEQISKSVRAGMRPCSNASLTAAYA